MKHKNILRGIICSIVAATAFSVTVYAQITEQSCTRRGTAVVFEGITDEKEGVVTYTVSEGTGNNGTEFGGKELYFIGEAVSDKDGHFSVSFSLDNSGDYVLRVKDTAGNILDKPIKYLNKADNGALLIKEINSGESERIKVSLDELDFDFDSKTWLDIKITNMEKWVEDCIKKNIPYANSDSLQKDFNVFVSLYYINNSKAATIAEYCGKYAEYLGVSQNADVNEFAENSTEIQKRALVQSLSSKPATDVNMLTNAIAAALKTNSSQGGGSTGGSSGGGNGSSGGSGGMRGTVGVQAPLQKPEDSSGNGSTQTTPSGFSDMDKAEWAREAVEALTAKGVISGDGNGLFRPNDEVTREEFVKMIVEAAGISSEATRCSFLDVFENDWFYPYVGAAQKAGIVSGMSSGIFGVKLKISRQDAAVIIDRTAEYMSKTLEEKRDFTDFSDSSMIADYAMDAVKKLYRSEIINGMGDGSFKPNNTCTRAEAAKMIYGLL